MKSPNACNYLPDHWSFNFCVCFLSKSQREKTEREKKQEGESEKRENKQKGMKSSQGSRRKTSDCTATLLRLACRRAGVHHSEGGGGRVMRPVKSWEKETGWREAGQDLTGRTPPPETPLSLSPLLHHSPSLPLSHKLATSERPERHRDSRPGWISII